MKCVLTFSFQAILIYLVSSTSDGFDGICFGDWKMNYARIIIGYLLHFALVPEIRCSLEMLRFAKNNPGRFKDSQFRHPVIISYMKLTTTIAVELMCVITIGSSTSVGDILADYITFGIIAEIDTIVGTIFNFDIQGEIDEANIEFPKQQLI